MIGLLLSCLVSLILTPFALTQCLTQIFVHCNRFNKGEINEVCTEWTFEEYRSKRHTHKTRNKLAEAPLLAPASIHTNKTKYLKGVI